MRVVALLAAALFLTACLRDRNLGPYSAPAEQPVPDAGPTLEDTLNERLERVKLKVVGVWEGGHAPSVAGPPIRLEITEGQNYRVDCIGGCGGFGSPFPQIEAESSVPDGHTGRFLLTSHTVNGESWGITVDDFGGTERVFNINRLVVTDGTLDFERWPVGQDGAVGLVPNRLSLLRVAGDD